MVPNKSFSEKFIFTLGGLEFHVLHLGPAHGPGDTQVWLPELSLMIAGDMAFHERMLPIFENTCTKCWLETWDEKFAPLNALYVIPSNGYIPNSSNVRVRIRDKIFTLMHSDNFEIKNIKFNAGSVSFYNCSYLTIEDSKFSYNSNFLRIES